MRSILSLVVSVFAAIVVSACVLLPQKLTLGTNTDQNFRQSGYSASLSWDLQKRRVTEEYVFIMGADFQPDSP